jgi:hypothetical protein
MLRNELARVSGAVIFIGGANEDAERWSMPGA